MSVAWFDIAVWLLGGGLLGWLAFALINANARWPAPLNMLSGAIGAGLAGALWQRIGEGTGTGLPDLSALLAGSAVAVAGALFAVGLLTVAGVNHRDDAIRIPLR